MKDCSNKEDGVCKLDDNDCHDDFRCDDYVSNIEPAKKDYNFLIIMVVIAVLTGLMIFAVTWFRGI